MGAVSRAVTIAILLFANTSMVYAETPLPEQKEYVPESGKGRVVIVVSGKSGPPKYQAFSKRMAEKGYYAVLVDSNDFWNKENNSGKYLFKDVIERAQKSPHALPGKTAVTGFSLGGGVALAFATKMPDLVSAVVAYYPHTAHIKDPEAYATKFKVPTLILAGANDTYHNCCMIEKARALDKGAREFDGNATFKLVVYPFAEHGFDIFSDKAYRMNDADDAFRRTLEHLEQHMGK
jgi:dienelactone hydrolase